MNEPAFTVEICYFSTNKFCGLYRCFRKQEDFFLVPESTSVDGSHKSNKYFHLLTTKWEER